MIQNGNIENPSQKLILLSGNMFDYIVRLLVWAVEGGDKVSKHPVQVLIKSLSIGTQSAPQSSISISKGFTALSTLKGT